MGAKVYEGHAARTSTGAKALVVSSAVDEQNPEVLEARRLQIPVIPRGELLAELMRLKYGIAVAGSHGKTTTTSMVATILNMRDSIRRWWSAAASATMGGSNARVGQSDFLVVESDESDGSFLKLAPILAVVTNIDREHLDHYPSHRRDPLCVYSSSSTRFRSTARRSSAWTIENVQQILPEIKRRTITYGTSAQADMRSDRSPRVRPSRERLSVCGYRGRRPRAVSPRHVPGVHNVLNATAAIAVALELEVKPDTIREALATFSGVDRRFQSARQGARHHRGRRLRPPSDRDRATLAAPALCGYQPHPRALPAASLHAHDAPDGRVRALVPPGRPRVRDGHLRRVREADRGRDRGVACRAHDGIRTSLRYLRGTIDKAVEMAATNVKDGDAVLTLGAGNVWQAGDKLLQRLRGGAFLIWRDAHRCDAETLRPRSKGHADYGRYVRLARPLLILVGILVAHLAYVTLENFLVTDSRFFLPGPPEPAERCELISV